MPRAALAHAIAQITGRPTPCSHWWVHTVYGAENPADNGRRCVLCGEKLTKQEWRRR